MLTAARSHDGQDVRALKKDDLRRKLGLGAARHFLFGDTVMETSLWPVGSTDDQVIAAAKAGRPDLHPRLPHGYQSADRTGRELEPGGAPVVSHCARVWRSRILI